MFNLHEIIEYKGSLYYVQDLTDIMSKKLYQLRNDQNEIIVSEEELNKYYENEVEIKNPNILKIENFSGIFELIKKIDKLEKMKNSFKEAVQNHQESGGDDIQEAIETQDEQYIRTHCLELAIKSYGEITNLKFSDEVIGIASNYQKYILMGKECK